MLAVVGAGSIGGYLAWQLRDAGHEVVLCVRTPFDHLEVTAGGATHVVDAPVVTEPQRLPAGLERGARWVLLATKAHHTPAAAPWLRALCGADTEGVVVLQNGVDHRERVAPYVGSTPVLPCVVNCAAEAVAPGRVVHHAYSSFDVPAGDLADRFAALLAGTDATVVPTDDFVTASWRKLIANITVSPITALTGRRMDVMADPGVQALAVGLAAECVAVANAVGARLDDDLPRTFVDGVSRNATSSFGSSMLYDREAGRPTEHDALTGAVVRHGHRLGIPVPLNEAMLALLSAAR